MPLHHVEDEPVVHQVSGLDLLPYPLAQRGPLLHLGAEEVARRKVADGVVGPHAGGLFREKNELFSVKMNVAPTGSPKEVC